MNIFIVGVGMGDTKYLTKIAEEKIKNADIIIGAKRVAEPYVNEKKVFFEYETDKIKKILEENKCENAVILFSGDTSFFSGAKKLKEEFPNAEIFAGISCVSYFCAKIGMAYDDMNIVSMKSERMRKHLCFWVKILVISCADTVLKMPKFISEKICHMKMKKYFMEKQKVLGTLN